jgi:hypothetical protein
MEAQIVWTGAMETAWIKAQQKPAPPLRPPAPPDGDRYLAARDAVALFLMQHHTQDWTMEELAKQLPELPHNTIRSAIKKLCSYGEVQRVLTGLTPGQHQRYRWSQES